MTALVRAGELIQKYQLREPQFCSRLFVEIKGSVKKNYSDELFWHKKIGVKIVQNRTKSYKL